MPETVTFSVRDLLLASFQHTKGPLPDGYTKHDGGADFALPLSALASEKLAVIDTSDITGERPVVLDRVDFLGGDAEESPIMSRLRFVETANGRGKLPTGDSLPEAVMTPIVSTYGDTGGIDIGEHEYEMTSAVKAGTTVSRESIIAAGEVVIEDMVLGAHRQAIRDRLLLQVLAGDGTGSSLTGIANMAGLDGGTYSAVGLTATDLQRGESAVEDGDGRAPYMAWAFGKALSDEARSNVIDPGSGRYIEERGRVFNTGRETQRIGSDLEATTGICADWGRIIVVVASELQVHVDAVTQPGMLRITTRLPVASPIVSGPVYVLRQA